MGQLHAIAYAPEDALGGFLDTPLSSAADAFAVSAFSLKSLTRTLLPLMQEKDESRGGSIVGLDFDASVAWPRYDWMGVSKAALEAIARYLARDLGPDHIRVNLVAAGPVATVAAQSIPGFDPRAAAWGRGAPLGWTPRDARQWPMRAAACSRT